MRSSMGSVVQYSVRLQVMSNSTSSASTGNHAKHEKQSRSVYFGSNNFQLKRSFLHSTLPRTDPSMSICKSTIVRLSIELMLAKASYIPSSPSGGFLPYWMLLVSSAAFYNVAQSYVVLWQTKEIYGKKPEQGKISSAE